MNKVYHRCVAALRTAELRKLFRWLALLAIPLFALRATAIMNIDPRTGFFRSGGWVLFIMSLLVVVAVVVWTHIKAKKATLNPVDRAGNPYTALLFGATGITAVIASIMQLIGSVRKAPLSTLFLSKTKLLLMGYESSHFQIEFWCSLAGFAAAVWFAWAAFRLIKTGSLSGNPIFCSLPVLWYILRALCDFSISTVNHNNSVIIVSIAANLMLALFLLRLVWVAALGYPKDSIARLAPYALLAFVFTIAFKTPQLAIVLQKITIESAPLVGNNQPLTLSALQPSSADFMLIITDTFAAISGFIATDQLLSSR